MSAIHSYNKARGHSTIKWMQKLKYVSEIILSKCKDLNTAPNKMDIPHNENPIFERDW